MKTSRILLISDVRPSRTWNFANRMIREVPGIEICGILQNPLRSIPWIQQMIAADRTREMLFLPGPWQKARLFFHSLMDRIVDVFFWFVHGCPAVLSNSRFTLKKLKQECARAGWPLAVVSEAKEAHTEPSFLKDADLAIVLGEFSSLPEFAVNAAKACIRACTRRPDTNGRSNGDAFIDIEHMTSSAGTPYQIFSEALPWQLFDGPLGFTLKADLISDDLLLQTARSLLAGNPETASVEVSLWAKKILAPSLSQLKGADRLTLHAQPCSMRCRSVWKLCLDTLLLLSPRVVGRNWYRRLTGRYPLLILAHHLVSDRPHRMGVPTETFWKQVLFLRKHYRIVTLSEASELLRSGQIRVPTVVLTFDDGYADNFLGLRAVASETGTPSMLFVTTGLVEAHREFDHDLATGKTGFLPLTWDQIMYWDTRGAEFGSHTRTHFDCSSTAGETLQSEIIGSRQDLESYLKKPVNFFAFPYGKQKNMSQVAMNLAASTYLHYLSAFGGESLANAERPKSHLFRKKFYGSPWELELELQSVFDFVDLLKERFSPRTTSPSSNPERAPVVSTLSPSIQTVSSPGSSTAIYSQGQEALKS